MTDSTDGKWDYRLVSNERLNESIGKRVSTIIHAKPELMAAVKELEKICDSHTKAYSSTGFERGGWKRNMILAWAYAGCVDVSINRSGDLVSKLGKYTNDIRNALEPNALNDPVVFVPNIYKKHFSGTS